jgi:hypothetical protein
MKNYLINSIQNFFLKKRSNSKSINPAFYLTAEDLNFNIDKPKTNHD